MNLDEGSPSKLTYILTFIFAVISIALCFGLFQAVLITLVGRIVVSLALAIVVSLPFVSAIQDAVVCYNKERHEERTESCK